MRRTVAFIIIAILGVTSSERSCAEPPVPSGVTFAFPDVQIDKEIDLALSVEFATGGGDPWLYDGKGFLPAANELASAMHENLKSCKIKSEIVGKTKVRVLGIEKDGKFYPAVLGTVKSKTIPADMLPKVTNPPKA